MANIVALRIANDQRALADRMQHDLLFSRGGEYDFTAYGRRTAAPRAAAPVIVARETTSPKWVEDERGIPQRVR